MNGNENLAKSNDNAIIKHAKESDYYLGGSKGTGRGNQCHALARPTVPFEPKLSPPPLGGTGGGD